MNEHAHDGWRVRENSTRASSNRHGYRGVEWSQARGLYRARIEPAAGRRGRWLGYFPTPEAAAEAYDEAAREVYGEHAFLNFPAEGERQAVQHDRSDGRCVAGHDLSVNGYARPDGRGVNCRACQREAASRSYRKRTASAHSHQEQQP